MKKIVLTFGLISGGILAGVTSLMVPMCMNATMSFELSEVVGYTVMVLSFLLVFFGVRSYRDTVGGGVITFGRALAVGLLVVLVASAVYVAAWEVVYYGFLPDFADKYATHALERMQAKGTTGAALEKARADMDRFRVMYRNPFFNVGMTFVEVLPVGVVVALVSAAILRRKTPPGAPEPAGSRAQSA